MEPGPAQPVEVYADSFGEPMSRYSKTGQIMAGQQLWDPIHECTAGFGAEETRGKKPNGDAIVQNFVLTAGHCFEKQSIIKRSGFKGDPNPSRIGELTRKSLGLKQEEYETDGEAVALNNDALAPRRIYVNSSNTPRVSGVARTYSGMRVCMSGVASDRKNCGKLRATAEQVYYSRNNGTYIGPMWQVGIDAGDRFEDLHGDSGAPVWQPSTGRAVGIYTRGPAPPTITTLLPPKLPDKGIEPFTKVTPGQAPGMDDDNPVTGKLHVLTLP